MAGVKAALTPANGNSAGILCGPMRKAEPHTALPQLAQPRKHYTALVCWNPRLCHLKHKLKVTVIEQVRNRERKTLSKKERRISYYLTLYNGINRKI